jgi:hypothetical protein
VLTSRRKKVDGTFETVKNMLVSSKSYLKGFVVIISAVFTFHFVSLRKSLALLTRSFSIFTSIILSILLETSESFDVLTTFGRESVEGN